MSPRGNPRTGRLALVGTAATPSQTDAGATTDNGRDARARALDWSILMAHAQAGDGRAYRRLLEEITPYLRSLAARSHRNSSDVEDCVQDVLLTVHAIRHTYDPTRPFGPWLVAIAHRRIADRLRRQGRTTARETPLADEHETFTSPAANYQEAASDAHALRSAVERLPQRQRDAIKLLKLQQLSLKEASLASGTSIAALKVATHRAMQNLRVLFIKAGD